MRRKISETVCPSSKRFRKLESTNPDSISMLPKDMWMRLLSLTLAETLVLTRCSRSLNAVFTAEQVWREFIKRVSPSLLTLPMNSVTNLKERLKVVLNKGNWSMIDYDKLRLHYILKVNGSEHVETLRPQKDGISRSQMCFLSGQDFDFKFSKEQVPSASLIVMLIHGGKTAVLMPESRLDCDQIGEIDGKVSYEMRYLHVCGKDLCVNVILELKCSNEEELSLEEFQLLQSSNMYFTGVDGVSFMIEHGSHEYLSCMNWY